MSNQISIKVPPSIYPILIALKGKEHWLSLLLDGAIYRGAKIGTDVKRIREIRTRETHFYCTSCRKYISPEEVVMNIARAKVRCPNCFGALSTKKRGKLLGEIGPPLRLNISFPPEFKGSTQWVES